MNPYLDPDESQEGPTKPKIEETRLISIVSKPIKIVVVAVVFVFVVLFVQNVSSKKCLVKKNLGQKMFDKKNLDPILHSILGSILGSIFGSLSGPILASILGYNIQ